MIRRNVTGQRLVAVALLGWLLFNDPLLSLFAGGWLLGLPGLFAYLFGAWTLLILLMILTIRRTRDQVPPVQG